MKIPTEFNGTIYFYWSLEYNWLNISDVELTGNRVLLHKMDGVNVKFDGGHNVAQEAINHLKNVIADIRAKAERDVSDVEQQIQSLLAIEYNGDDND